MIFRLFKWIMNSPGTYILGLALIGGALWVEVEHPDTLYYWVLFFTGGVLLITKLLDDITI